MAVNGVNLPSKSPRVRIGEHGSRPAKLFLYEAQRNLTLYVGPDFYHGRPEVAVINTLVLDAQHRPVESYTMRFGLE
jgi:hypothetical protein